MTPEAQRIAIAEACGHICPNSDGIWRRLDRIPLYLSDLNAMHEAEEALDNFALQERFITHLSRVCYRTDKTNRSMEFIQTHATAAQRAETFLRTLNLWDDK